MVDKSMLLYQSFNCSLLKFISGGGVDIVLLTFFLKVSNLLSFLLKKVPRYNLGHGSRRMLIKLFKFMLIKLSKFIDDDHLVRASSKNGMGRYEGRQAIQYRKLCSTAYMGGACRNRVVRWRMEH